MEGRSVSLGRPGWGVGPEANSFPPSEADAPGVDEGVGEVGVKMEEAEICVLDDLEWKAEDGE